LPGTWPTTHEVDSADPNETQLAPVGAGAQLPLGGTEVAGTSEPEMDTCQSATPVLISIGDARAGDETAKQIARTARCFNWGTPHAFGYRSPKFWTQNSFQKWDNGKSRAWQQVVQRSV